jgi:hypothetical protein
MPAVSKAQQRFMGMVHAAQKGDMENPSPEVEKAADSMSDKDAKDFASTSHKGLTDKKENMITRNRLKEIVKEVMVEEAEYQTFFKKALEKAGKGINDMSDNEKKAFFDKVDSAWNGKGEKNETLTGGQKKLDVDKDGDIEGDDLADLRAGKKANENIATELPKATIPSSVKQKLDIAIDKIKDSKLNPTQKLQLVAQVIDSLGIDKSQLGTITTKIRSKMESIDEARDAEGNEFPELEDVKTAVKKIIQNNDVEKLLRNKVIAYLQKEKGFSGAGNTNSSRLFDKVINDLLKH